MRAVPVLWEVWDGKTYVGYVERCYVGKKPWAAYWDDHELDEEHDRYRTKQQAVAAVKKAWKARER
jgi:hypothetical protein